MSLLVYFGVLALVLAVILVKLVAQGIHIRTAAPSQRRSAWLEFIGICGTLLLGIGIWWSNYNLLTQEALPPLMTGWLLACILPLFIALGILAVRSLILELRQASVHHATSMGMPPEAGGTGL